MIIFVNYSQNYTEQPGVQPHIRYVTTPDSYIDTDDQH